MERFKVLKLGHANLLIDTKDQSIDFVKNYYFFFPNEHPWKKYHYVWICKDKQLFFNDNLYNLLRAKGTPINIYKNQSSSFVLNILNKIYEI